MSASMSGPSGGDTTRLITALQSIVTALYSSQQVLSKGISVNTSLPVYTVAGLPAAAPAGMIAYASNGRNPGETAGNGTGCAVIGNGTVWRSVWSGVAVVS